MIQLIVVQVLAILNVVVVTLVVVASVDYFHIMPLIEISQIMVTDSMIQLIVIQEQGICFVVVVMLMELHQQVYGQVDLIWQVLQMLMYGFTSK